MGQTAFYQPQSFLEKKEYDRAIFMILIAAEISPESPGLWIEIASIQLLKGKAGRKKALEALRTAVNKGLKSPEALEGEELADLREMAEFQELVRIVRGRKTAGAPSTAPPPP